MFEVLKNTQLNENTFQLEISAADIALHYQAGQFVIIRTDEFAERIPLTIAKANTDKGSIEIIFQAIGIATKKLSDLQENAFILDVLGPLGVPSHLPEKKNVILVSGGVGTAIAIPTLRALKTLGNTITSILGFRTYDLVILENEVKQESQYFHLATDDGSSGTKGLVTDVLKPLLEKDIYDFIYCIGPIPMMKAVTELAKVHAVPIQVSLNPIMIDGTGMCGCCRVNIAGETRFACIDGPEFDGALVDFDELGSRNNAYREHHKCNMERYYEK